MTNMKHRINVLCNYLFLRIYFVLQYARLLLLECFRNFEKKWTTTSTPKIALWWPGHNSWPKNFCELSTASINLVQRDFSNNKICAWVREIKFLDLQDLNFSACTNKSNKIFPTSIFWLFYGSSCGTQLILLFAISCINHIYILPAHCVYIPLYTLLSIKSF